MYKKDIDTKKLIETIINKKFMYKCIEEFFKEYDMPEKEYFRKRYLENRDKFIKYAKQRYRKKVISKILK